MRSFDLVIVASAAFTPACSSAIFCAAASSTVPVPVAFCAVEWYAGGAKYDYEIATDTGEIISSAYEEKTMGTDSKIIIIKLPFVEILVRCSAYTVKGCFLCICLTDRNVLAVCSHRFFFICGADDLSALDRVSGATDKDLYEWKLDYDDGRPEYEGKIIYGFLPSSSW